MHFLLPFTIPALTTLVFVFLSLNSFYFAGVWLIPFVTYFHKYIGKFNDQELFDVYNRFQSNPLKTKFLLFNGFFFVGFQLFIVYHLMTIQLEWYNLLFFIYSVVLLNANFSISLAHELMHAKSKTDRFISKIILLINGFFYLETDHLYIHHVHLGTKKDPASALFNENIYRYYLRSIPNRMKLVMGLQQKDTDIPMHEVQKTRCYFIICCLLLLTTYFINLQVFIWLLVQSIVVPLIYDAITYIQHYGLARKHQKVSIHDSWNCNYKLSAYMHFFMPIHAIHHLPQHIENNKMTYFGKTFPKPFSKMIILAFNPKKWFEKVNPLITNSSK